MFRSRSASRPCGLLWPVALACALGEPAAAQQPAGPPLRFVAATSNALPLAEFDAGDHLVRGIVKDLAELIAGRLGRPLIIVPLPSKRVRPALAAGEVDAVCYVMPDWLPGDFHWTPALIPDASVVVAHADAPPLGSLSELADQPLGTVLGYRYPLVEAALGLRLRRADAISMAANLRRLAAGRVRYALVEKTALQYFLREQPGAPLHIVWTVERFDARCAFAPASGVSNAELDSVMAGLLGDGSIERVLARYR